jgi:hypothetical protein
VTRLASKFALAALLSMAISAVAASQPSVSGVVRSANRAPVMGAVVELFGSSALPVLTALTDIHGRFRFSNLAPGQYSVRVQEASTLPNSRKKVRLGQDSHAVVDFTLISLFDTAQWFPAVPRSADEPADDWKWALRSTVDRPMLRWLDASAVNSSRKQEDAEIHPTAERPVRVRAALTSGSSKFGEGGFQQEAFLTMRQGTVGDAVVHLRTSTSGAAFVAGGIERNPGFGDVARAVANFRTLPVDDGNGLARLAAFQVRGGEQMVLSDALKAQFGAETEAIQAGQTVTAALPFMTVHFAQGANKFSYRLATATDLQGLDDLASAGEVPPVAMASGKLRLARALHQEVSVERKMAGMRLEAAYFYDRMSNPILNGYGDVQALHFSPGDVLLDPITGAFRTVGPNFSGSGFRIVAERPLNGGVWTAVEYADGPAVEIPAADLAAASSFAKIVASAAATRAQSVLVSMRGQLPFAGTKWDAGYRWQPDSTITAVDPFSVGMGSPYFSVVLKQPIGSSADSPLDRLALEFVMQNILAQGYRPVYVIAGKTLYLAQGPRLFTGGLAFSF